jgi:CRP-like cAMP-binding protein
MMSDSKQTRLYEKITSMAGNITSLDLEKLFGLSIHKRIAKGHNLLNEGQICNSIAFIESGYFRTFIVKEGIEINTDFIFENSFVTNLKSLRLSVPSDTTIMAGEDTLIYEFDKNELRDLYKESPQIESFSRNLLEQLLIQQEEHTNLFKILSPKERYTYLQSNRPEIIQRVSLSQISSYLGVARETLSRYRKIKT